MPSRPCLAAMFLGILMLAPAAPAFAQGEILITQAKAIAGNVTPGDAPDFPVTLSLPGSYKLADNLTPGPNKNGLVVTAPDVTIDLNGFRLSGGPAGGANNSLSGIWAQSDRLTVKNGTIGAFRTAGINAANYSYLIVENMRIVNGAYGIYNPNSYFARIQNSTIATNTRTGIVCGQSCHVEGNVISRNSIYGIQLSSGTVLGNTIMLSYKYGIYNASIGVGYGNNTLIDNNGAGPQALGNFFVLFPNACFPGGCQ